MFPKSTRILIVDDFPTMRKITKKVLSEMGFTDIDEASDGEKAWALIKKANDEYKPFGLIISDWEMPEIEGLELLRLCRQEPHFQTLPFILMASESHQNLIRTAADAGVSDYLIKPFNAATLKAKLEKVWLKHNTWIHQKVA